MKISKYLIFVIILTSQLSFKLTAQDFNGKYFPVEGLDKFAGTWESMGSNKDFRLILTKKKVLIKLINAYTDQMEGYYIHENKRSNDDAIKFGMMPTDHEGNIRYTTLYFYIHDIGLDKHGQGFLNLETGSTEAGTLRITNPEGMRSDKYNFLFSIPTEIRVQKII